MMTLLKRWVLAFVAPKPLVGVLHLRRYVRDFISYRRSARLHVRPALADTYPCLTDWTPSTPFDPHYFHQGAWLAGRLAQSKPALHVDVGSSVMMVGVLCAQVPILFVDYRPLEARMPGLFSVAGDIKRLPFADASVHSLSCLHVLEHIGLGRYGDPIDAEGSARGAAELARVLAPGGHLYVSVPTGVDRVCFNAHRVFSPRALQALFPGLNLLAFSLVDDGGGFDPAGRLDAAARLEYGCGMYVFRKD
jgi:SAM-dependent methyltransferase